MSIDNEITKEEIFSKFNSLNLSHANCLFVASDLGKIGLIPGKNKKYLLDTIYKNIVKINPNVTIIVPTANFNLINSDKTFNLKNTPSFRMGAFSEYIRKFDNSRRSYHPFWSLTALGPLADKIVSKISDHAYDHNSAFANLFKIKNSHFLAIGDHPRFMLAIIHHFENMFKVPYRFEKTFKINCIKDNQIKTEYFKLDVLKDKFRSKKRSFNKKIFEHFEQNKVLHNITLGKGKIYYFNIQDFYATTCELFEKDINCWWK